MRKVFSGLLVGLVLSWGGIASAAPSYCNSGAGDLNTAVNDDTPTLQTSDMTYNGNPATDCYGAVTKDNDDVGDINALLWGIGWQFAARDNTGEGKDDVSNGVAGILWSLTTAVGNPNAWTLTGVDQNGPSPANLGDAFDFVGVLKGGNGWAAYFFDNVTFDGSDGGTWKVSFLNNGGKIPDLSHMSIYARQGDVPFDVPEPSGLALAGLGFLGLALTRRRRTPITAH